MSTTPHVPERRAYPRRRVAVTAFIQGAAGHHLPCGVVDIAPNSARIRADDIALPNKFVLILKLDRTVRRHCRVVWWNSFVTGVQFTAWLAELR